MSDIIQGKMRGIALILMFFLLAGCIPAVFLAGATAGTVVYDKRSMKTMVEDKDASNTALRAVNSEMSLRSSRIVIATFNQVMLMAGQTPTEALRSKAYSLVSGVPNVKRIYNEVTIQEPISLRTKSNDTWITTKVKSAVLTEKGLNSSQIKVVTENSVVYLMGVLTHKQADSAAEVASRVSGVQKVVKIFEYEQ